MKIETYTNCGDDQSRRFTRGYSPGDRLLLTYTGDIADEDHETDEHILESAFARLNRDNRPNGKIAPSLSVGDVVTINPDAGRNAARSYAVLGVGWERLPEPVIASEEQRQRYARSVATQTPDPALFP